MSDYAEKKAAEVELDWAKAIWTGDAGMRLVDLKRGLLVTAIDEAMRDQRHACAEAVISVDHCGDPVHKSSTDTIHEAHQAVMNAEVKP